MLIHALFDNSSYIAQLPPSPMTANTTSINGQNYIATSSTGTAYLVLDNNPTTYLRMSGYNASGGLYIANTVSTTTTTGLILGEWVQIQLPTAKTCYTFTVSSRTASSSKPKRVAILGSNDTANPWIKLYESQQDFIFYNSTDIENELVNNSTPYLYYRMILTKVTTQTFADIVEWRLFEDTSTNRSSLIYRNPSLYGRYKLDLICLYVDSYNFNDTRNLLYVSSPQLTIPGSNNTLLILHEVPVSELVNKKVYHMFSDKVEIYTELNGIIELFFKRNNIDVAFRRVLIVFQAERINYLTI